MTEITLSKSLAEVLNTACPFAVNETFKAMGGGESSGPTMAESVTAEEARALYER
jgi:hypothetical protein